MNDNYPTSKDRLQHILEAITRIQQFCTKKTVKDFKSDEMLYNAVLFQFIIIGEAVANVDQDFLYKYDYPWHLPRSFRNYIAHEYFGVIPERIWNTIQQELNPLKITITNILKEQF